MIPTPTLQDVKHLVAFHLGRPSVADEARIIEDLGAESVDVVNIIAAIEERYGITIEEAELPDIRSVADLFELVRSRVPAK